MHPEQTLGVTVVPLSLCLLLEALFRLDLVSTCTCSTPKKTLEVLVNQGFQGFSTYKLGQKKGPTSLRIKDLSLNARMRT